jgi:hypothetical protein
MIKNTIKILFATASVALLTACGGGGGGTAEQITPPTLDLRNAWANYFQQNSSRNYTISGTINGTNVSGNGTSIIAYTSPVSVLAIDISSPFPGPSLTISNLSKTSLVSNSTLIVNSQSTLSSSTSEYYFESTGEIKMIKNVNDDEQTIVTSFTNFPVQVTAGTAGILYAGTIFSRLGYTCGTENQVYSVAGETNTALIVTITSTQNTKNSTVGQCTTRTTTSQNKYRLTTNGLSPVESVGSISTATGSLTFTF